MGGRRGALDRCAGADGGVAAAAAAAAAKERAMVVVMSELHPGLLAAAPRHGNGGMEMRFAHICRVETAKGC